MTMVLGPSKAVLAGEAGRPTRPARGQGEEPCRRPRRSAERAKPVTRDKQATQVLGSPEQLAD